MSWQGRGLTKLRTNKYVLDSFAILTLLQQEKGWEYVKELLTKASRGDSELHMSIINLAEVKYLIIRRNKDVEQTLAAIEALPIHFASADEYIQHVVDLKANYPVSLADCFAAALAIAHDCQLVTADPEFRKMESILQVYWLR